MRGDTNFFSVYEFTFEAHEKCTGDDEVESLNSDFIVHLMNVKLRKMVLVNISLLRKLCSHGHLNSALTLPSLQTLYLYTHSHVTTLPCIKMVPYRTCLNVETCYCCYQHKTKLLQTMKNSLYCLFYESPINILKECVSQTS